MYSVRVAQMVFFRLSKSITRVSNPYTFGGGSERIRTAVQGFADLCLAARPRNLMSRLAGVVGTTSS